MLFNNFVLSWSKWTGQNGEERRNILRGQRSDTEQNSSSWLGIQRTAKHDKTLLTASIFTSHTSVHQCLVLKIYQDKNRKEIAFTTTVPLCYLHYFNSN